MPGSNVAVQSIHVFQTRIGFSLAALHILSETFKPFCFQVAQVTWFISKPSRCSTTTVVYSRVKIKIRIRVLWCADLFTASFKEPPGWSSFWTTPVKTRVHNEPYAKDGKIMQDPWIWRLGIHIHPYPYLKNVVYQLDFFTFTAAPKEAAPWCAAGRAWFHGVHTRLLVPSSQNFWQANGSVISVNLSWDWFLDFLMVWNGVFFLCSFMFLPFHVAGACSFLFIKTHEDWWIWSSINITNVQPSRWFNVRVMRYVFSDWEMRLKQIHVLCCKGLFEIQGSHGYPKI